MSIVFALILLSILILIHELGHYIAARIFKVTIKEFSIFMGPKLLSKNVKGIDYTLRLIPIGGYVAMEGETEDSEDENALNRKPKWQQAIIMAAGAFVNIVFGILAFIILTTSSGYVSNNLDAVNEQIPDLNSYISDEAQKYDLDSPAKLAGLQDGDEIVSFNSRKIVYPVDLYLFALESNGDTVEIEYIRNGNKHTTDLTPTQVPSISTYKIGVYFNSDVDKTNVVLEIIPDMPAQTAGLMAGDEIIMINDTKVSNRNQISDEILKNKDLVAKFVVLRDGETKTINIRPEESISDATYYNGLYFQEGEGGLFARVGAGSRYFISVIRSVYFSIKWLITGAIGLGDAMGPVGIVTTLGSVVSSNETISTIIKELLSMLGLISVNLGLVNLLPIPPLDGSKLLIIFIEKVSRKKISMEKQATISMIGFVLLIVLLFVITGSDIKRIFGG